MSLLLALIISLRADSAPDLSKVDFKTTRLSSSLYMVEGTGGNMTASVGQDGTLLVDCDFAQSSEKLVAKLKDLKGQSPRFIVNTHFHYDHTGGNQYFGRTATIISSSSVRDRLMEEQILWKKKHPSFPHVGLPILTFERSLTLHLNNDEIKVVHFPQGHTDGDTVVFFDKDKVVSLGDLFFSGMYPIFHPEHGGNLDDYLKNLKSILMMITNEAKLIPGHGPLSSKIDFKKYVEMIEASIEVVKNGIGENLTLEQIQKRGLPKKWASFGHGYRNTEQWIESIYKSARTKK